MVSYSTKKIFDFPFLRRQLEIFSCFYSLFFFWPEQSGTPGLEPGTDFILKLFHMYSWVYILNVFRDLAINTSTWSNFWFNSCQISGNSFQFHHFVLNFCHQFGYFFVAFRHMFKCQAKPYSPRSPKYVPMNVYIWKY